MYKDTIPQLKKAEAELKKANTYLENIFENSPDAIGIVDKFGKFIKWNKMAAELYGYTFEELLGKSSLDLYADRNELQNMLQHLRQEGSVKKWAMQMKRKDGKVVPFEISISLLRNSENRTVGSVTVARDLSEIKKVLEELQISNDQLSQEIAVRRQAEAEVRRLSRQNQLILNAAGEGIIGVDIMGRIVLVNPAGAEILGYEAEELIGKDLHELVHHSKEDGSRYPLHECPMHQSLSTGIIRRERDELFWKKDGTSYTVAYSSTPLTEKGRTVGAVVTFRDITKQQSVQKKLNKYRDHLKNLLEKRTAELEKMSEKLNQLKELNRAEKASKKRKAKT
ncbi:MAG: PAS domain-containing protein [Syntrophobacteraceae bacterium]